jgi:hypothetical protein
VTRNQRYKVTKLLLFAMAAPTFAERRTLLDRVVNKTGITFRAAYQRLGRMSLSLEQGNTAIDAYEAKRKAVVNVVIHAHQAQTKLLIRLGLLDVDMRAWIERPVSVSEAARILRVRKSQVKTWLAVGILIPDGNGTIIRMGEIRRFIGEAGRWALPKTRTRAKPLREGVVVADRTTSSSSVW